MAEKLFDMEVSTTKPGVYSITQKQRNAYYEEQGVDLSAIKKLKEAETALTKGALEFLKPKVIKAKEKQTFLMGQGDGQLALTLSGESTVRTIPKKKGDPVNTFTKYGNVSLRIKKKVPSALKEDISKLQADIEKAFKK